MRRTRFLRSCIVLFCVGLFQTATSLPAEPYDPSAADYTGRKGMTLYVSKLGDNSDGSSWAKAFHTIQAALSAVPDDKGGHRIIVRPDRYMEQNLHAIHEGAKGSYNLLQADFDGSLGSGATGYAVFDAGDPVRGNTSEKINNFLQSREYAGEIWDRWIVRHVYATGADAGVFWDLGGWKRPSSFTILVEDCVGIGRAFGGGIAAHVNPRPDEPVVFRRCWLYSLDWIGDAAAVYVRAENSSMPDCPDAIFEDCTMVAPDNALQAGNPGYDGYTRVRFKNCRMISLNFAMPSVGNSTGIIHSTIKGRYLHVDLQDCQMLGYKVFGSGDGKRIPYSTTGTVRAYIQTTQEAPKGFERVGPWPTELFEAIGPPETGLENQ